MIVANADLVLVEGRHLPQYQVILSQGRQACSAGAQSVLEVWPRRRTIFGILLSAFLLWTLPIDGRLPSRVRLEDGTKKDAMEEVLRNAILFIQKTVDEPDHLLLDHGQLSVVLQGLNQRLPAKSGGVRSLRQFYVHVSSQPVYLIDVSFLELILLKIIRILHNLKAVLEDQLDEFVVYLERFLYP